MNTPTKVLLISFAAIAPAILIAGVAWCGGFNFDRGSDGGMLAYLAVAAGFISSVITASTLK